jgi:predicted dehydrogenase
VDVLYIATPHPQHAPIALGGAAAGKALLVEKSFTATCPALSRWSTWRGPPAPS